MANFNEQKKTLDDAKRLLKRYHKAFIIRPTGFGKTWMLTELIRSYDSVLYLYPSAVIANTVIDRYNTLEKEDIELEFAKNNDDENYNIDPETIETYNALKDNTEIKNCELMTYAMLIRKSDDELKALAKKHKLIICDEAHRLGGYKTKIATEKLFSYAKKSTDFIGATATPTRMDNFDVASHFFGDRLTYVYTLFDAIENKLIQKPKYCYMTYDIRKDLENAFIADSQDINDTDVKNTINAKTIEIAKLYNVPNIIRDTCDKHAVSTNYMRFIVFFASKKHMSDKLNDVIEWFHEAYPDHKIKTLKISSANKTEAANTDKLSLLSPQDKTIDLIACIDMLNVGYHMTDLTGICMYRGTKSNTIFTQQFGRALSSGANNSAIVFDIVDNLHRKAVYELYVKTPKKRKKTTAKNKTAMLDNYVLDENTNKIMYAINDERIESQYHLDPETNKILDKNNNESTFEYNPETNEIINTADVSGTTRDINIVTAECLEATGHEAAYKDIIAKAMVESMAQRCKYALQLHFRSWCYAHNVPYPITEKELEESYDLDILDFYEKFKEIIRLNKIAYPLHDAKELFKIGNEPNDIDVPLAICCEDRGTSIEKLMELIFNKYDENGNKTTDNA